MMNPDSGCDIEDIPLVFDEDGLRRFEKFLVITNQQACDLHCPWCTGKATNYPFGDDQLEELVCCLEHTRRAGIRFNMGIISGNGEPSFLGYEDLRKIRDTLKTQHFEEYLFQTGGNLFWDTKKFELFWDWTMELTRGAFDPKRDMTMRGYKRDYTKTETFRKARLGLNITLIEENLPDLPNEIDRYLNAFGDRLVRLTLKVLNINTRTGKPDNPYSQWVFDHGVPPEKSETVAELVSSRYSLKQEYDPVLDRIVWDACDVPLIMEMKKRRYGRLHMAFSQGKLQDYLLRQFSFPSNDRLGSFVLR
ncbi:hypothetical protein HYV70_03045 [Candidatus Uhrbacteria bacterium]|nr:hypothetical protein [Candidatus Uhrbacteria bacterium]